MIEWWNAYQGNMIGAIGGSAVGVFCGILGAMAGTFAPRGRFKGFVLGSMGVLVAVGAATLAAGITALVVGQPYHVWYPLTLGGTIGTCVMGGLLPMFVMRYRQAEARRMEAEGLRRS